MKKLLMSFSLLMLLLLNIYKMVNGECYLDRRSSATPTGLVCFNANAGHISKFSNFEFASVSVIDSNIPTFHHKIIQLRNHSSVIRLALNDDDIGMIEKDAFKDFPSLKTLVLSNNKLVTFGRFDDLQNLQELTLSNNHIRYLEENCFQNFTSLELLDLSYNNLQTLGNATVSLPKLKQLIVKNNTLSVLDAFNNNKILEILDLSSNQLQFIGKHFANLQNLEQLFLNDNLLSKLDEAFTNLKRLQHLNLQNNKLLYITANLFKGLTRLEQLYLSGNMIKQIEPQSFLNLTKLSFLNLLGNDLKKITNGTFEGLQNIHFLNLSSLNIQTIEPGGFSGLQKLLTLDLSKNQIQTFEEATFLGLSSLDHLFLSNNPLNLIKPNAFLGLTRLEMLSMRNINIPILNPNTFNEMPALGILEFITEDIQEIKPGAFNNLTGLFTLIIGNRNMGLSSVKLENGTFRGLSRLSDLYLINFRIEVIGSNTFNGLSMLHNIHLQNCTIRNISEGAFSGLNKADVISSCEESMHFGNILGRSQEFCHLSIEAIEAGALGDLYSDPFSGFMYNHLHLDHNKLKVVHQNMFNTISHVGQLTISNNNIDELETGAFNGLSFYKKPCVYESSLKSKVFMCNTIDLSNNTILVLKNDTFPNLKDLVSLKLDFNVIEEIELEAFGGLQFNIITNTTDASNTLFLNNNKLKVLKSNRFGKIRNLNKLRLDYNEIQAIEPNAFRGLTFISKTPEGVLLLNNNKLTVLVSNSLSEIKGVTELRLDHNQIKEIQTGTFNNTIFSDYEQKPENSNVLNLSYNKLQKLTKNGLQGISNLMTLKFNYNTIKTIEQGAFSGLNQLVLLNLSYNKIENLPGSLFEDLQNLKTLDLSSNEINSIDVRAFSGLNSIKQLLLYNNKIADLSLGTLNNFVTLENLQLGNNRLLQLKIGSFTKLDRLKYLNISHNNLSVLNEHVLYPLRNLELLDVDNNNLTYLNYTSLIQHLSSLRFVSVNNNNWPCHVLMPMIKSFKRERIYYLFNPTTQYTEENIEGILCNDINPEISAGSNKSEDKSEEYKALLYFNKWKSYQNNSSISDIVDVLNNIVLKFDKLISTKHPAEEFNNLSWILRDLAGATNNNTNILSDMKDAINKPTVAADTNKESTVTLDLNPFATMLFLVIGVSTITTCVLLITDICRRRFKKIKTYYRLDKSRSEMELLDTSA